MAQARLRHFATPPAQATETTPPSPVGTNSSRLPGVAQAPSFARPRDDQQTVPKTIAKPVKEKEKPKLRKKLIATTVGPPQTVEPPEEILDHRFGVGPLPVRLAVDIVDLGRKGPKVPVGKAAPVYDFTEGPASGDEGGTRNPITLPDDCSTDESVAQSSVVFIPAKTAMAIAVLEEEQQVVESEAATVETQEDIPAEEDNEELDISIEPTAFTQTDGVTDGETREETQTQQPDMDSPNTPTGQNTR